ncbi:MAG: recombinase RecT, partial [Opitutaceae bacterium]
MDAECSDGSAQGGGLFGEIMNALVEFQNVLATKKNAIAGRLPAHLRKDVDRMVKIALTAAAKTPKILQCSQESIMLSIMQAAELGLEPGGALG